MTVLPDWLDAIVDKATSTAASLNQENPNSYHPYEASTLLLAAYMKAVGSQVWAGIDEKELQLARKWCSERGGNPDEVVSAYPGQLPMICKTPLGDVTATVQTAAGSVPLWVHYYAALCEIRRLEADANPS